MAAPKRASQADGLAQQGELAELLRLEARLAERLTALELQTEHIRAEALARRSGAETESAARLEVEMRGLEARLESECRARIESIGQAAEEEARRLRAIDDASVQALAERVAARVLAAASEELDP